VLIRLIGVLPSVTIKLFNPKLESKSAWRAGPEVATASMISAPTASMISLNLSASILARSFAFEISKLFQ
jgi:hypothetical protein